MRMIFKTCVLSFYVFVLFCGTSLAADGEPDIRFRSIIYFYPGSEAPDLSGLSDHFGEFEIVRDLPEVAALPVMSYALIEDVKAQFPVPDLNYLGYFGRGLGKEQAERIQHSSLALVIDIAYPLTRSFEGMKAAGISLFRFAKAKDALIWDSETRELFTPDAWRKKRIAAWDGEFPIVEDHIVIHAYSVDDGVRAITLGMAKFGLPDIVVNDFSWSLTKSMGNLINLVAQSITEGIGAKEQGGLALSIKDLADTRYKNDLIESLMDNAIATADLQIGQGQWEEGDPNNYLIELLFDDAPGNTLSEKHDALLSSLFGWEDQIAYVQHNEEIKAASARARRKLNGLRDDFNSGLAPGEFIQLKAPFETPDGGAEWMWVEVLAWQEGVITGLLKNEPFHIPDLKGGSEVSVQQEDVFDYIRIYPDGNSEGNETGALIMKYQQ